MPPDNVEHDMTIQEQLAPTQRPLAEELPSHDFTHGQHIVFVEIQEIGPDSEMSKVSLPDPELYALANR